MSFASYMAVTFILKREGRDLRTFLTKFVSVSFSSSAKDSLARSKTRTLNYVLVSSSAILRASNFEDRIWSLEIMTLEVHLYVVSRIFHASFVEE